MKNSTPRTFVGTTTFTIIGLTSDECARVASEAITTVGGVESVYVDKSTGSVTVTVTRPVDRADIAQAVEDAGFTLMA